MLQCGTRGTSAANNLIKLIDDFYTTYSIGSSLLLCCLEGIDHDLDLLTPKSVDCTLVLWLLEWNLRYQTSYCKVK